MPKGYYTSVYSTSSAYKTFSSSVPTTEWTEKYKNITLSIIPANQKILKRTNTAEAVPSIPIPCTGTTLNVDNTVLTEYLFLYNNNLNIGPILLRLGSSTGDFVDGMTVYFYQAKNEYGDYPCVQTWDSATNTVICATANITYISPYICGISFPGQVTEYTSNGINYMNEGYYYNSNGILPGFIRIANNSTCAWSDYIPITYADSNNNLPVVKSNWIESLQRGPINCTSSTTSSNFSYQNPCYNQYSQQDFGDICFKNTTSSCSAIFKIFVNPNSAWQNELITGVLFVWANNSSDGEPNGKLQYWYQEGMGYGKSYDSEGNGHAYISVSCYFTKANSSGQITNQVLYLNPDGQEMYIIPLTSWGPAIMNVPNALYNPGFMMWNNVHGPCSSSNNCDS